GDNEPQLYFAAGGRLVVVSTTMVWSSDTTQLAIWDLDTGKRLALPEPARAVYGRPEDPFVLTAAAANGRQGGLAHVRDARTLTVVGKPLEVAEIRGAAVSAD